MKLGENIRTIRKSRGLTQQMLADRMGLVKATISSWELNRTQPKMEIIEQLCLALDCKKSDLIGKDNISTSHELLPEEWDLILAYRRADNISKEAVCRLLIRGVVI